MHASGPRFDFDRMGVFFRASPRQADVMIVAGTVNWKMAETVRRLYDEMPEPKWVVAMGACACTGGPFREYPNVIMGVDKVVPVDVYIPGCPPRPESVQYGFMHAHGQDQGPDGGAACSCRTSQSLAASWPAPGSRRHVEGVEHLGVVCRVPRRRGARAARALCATPTSPSGSWSTSSASTPARPSRRRLPAALAHARRGDRRQGRARLRRRRFAASGTCFPPRSCPSARLAELFGLTLPGIPTPSGF